jgi:hypothetical protein
MVFTVENEMVGESEHLSGGATTATVGLVSTSDMSWGLRCNSR